MQSLMGGFRLAVGRVSLVHTLCYCQHRARGRRARLDAGGQRMPCKFSSLRTLYFCQHRARGAPSTSRCRRREEGPPCRLNLLHTPELITNCRTVTPRVFITPSNDGSIFWNRSKGLMCGLNLLHTLELISNSRTVTAIACMTPGNDGSIFQNRSKGPFGGLNLLHTLELISHCRTVTAIA